MSKWRQIAAVLLIFVALVTAVGCGKTETVTDKKAMVNITPADLKKLFDSGKAPMIVDVRTPEEYAAGHIPGAKLIPLQTIEEGIKAIDKKQEMVLVCRSGNRSAQAYEILAGMGYSSLKNMTGGMTEWEKIGGSVSR